MNDVNAVAERSDGATTPLGPWAFDADNPDLIYTGMAIDLQPAIDLHTADAAMAVEPAPVTDAGPDPVAVPEPVADPSPSVATQTSADTTVEQAAGSVGDPVTAAPDAPATPATPLPAVATAAAPATPHVVPTPEVADPARAAAQPGDLAPAAPAHVDDSTDSDTTQLPLVPLAVAGMTLGGLILAVDRHRRRRQAHDPHGRPAALPDGELLQHERVLRAAARLDRAARTNAALRHLADELAARATVLRPRYIVVDDNDVVVVLPEPASPPSGWEHDPDDSRRWRCVLDDTSLAYAADVNPHPWPAVVPLGTTIDGDATILVDLEALGSLALDGPGGADVCAAVLCALGASPHADMLTVVDDGHIALYGLGPHLQNRVRVDDIDALLDRLETWIEPFRFESRHVLAQRHDDPGELEPCVAAIVARIDDTARRRLTQLPLDGSRPIAVLTTDTAAARTILTVDEHGLATFDDQPIRCHRLTPTIATTALELIEQADTAPPIEDELSDLGKRFEQPSLFAPDPDAWTIRLMGPLRIRHRNHGELQPERRRQLLTLLALHPNGLTGEEIYDAVVPDKVADSDTKRRYAKARISELRKALGDGDTVAGRNYLPLTSHAGNDRYRVENVELDLVRFRHLVSQTDAVSLTAAMELIDGEIGGDELAWFPWAPSTVHEIHALVVETGRRLGAAAMTDGRPDLADWVATQTRLAVPFDQSVVPIAIKARSLLGDRVGVRRLRDELDDTHNGELANDVRAAFDDALAAG
jgi:hypothetical protein